MEIFRVSYWVSQSELSWTALERRAPRQHAALRLCRIIAPDMLTGTAVCSTVYVIVDNDTHMRDAGLALQGLCSPDSHVFPPPSPPDGPPSPRAVKMNWGQRGRLRYHRY